MRFFLFAVTMLPFIGLSQINGITEEGYQIQLFEDGTWMYLDTSLKEERFIKESDSLYIKPEDSKIFVNSNIIDVKVTLNDNWFFYASPENEDSEFSFNNKSAEIYALLISEKVQIPLNNLRNIALINARQTVENLQIITEEYRNVNGVKILYLCFEGKVDNLKLRYNNYYYSGDQGIAQLITYAEKKVAKEYNQAVIDFLNGFSKIDQ